MWISCFPRKQLPGLFSAKNFAWSYQLSKTINHKNFDGLISLLDLELTKPATYEQSVELSFNAIDQIQYNIYTEKRQ